MSAAGREWRQFRLLAHDSVRRLIASAVLTRDGDPWQFAIWVTALAATPPSLYASSQMFKYAALRRATPRVMEFVVLADRTFFVLYAMVIAALLAALTWEALVPDRTDQEIVGVLPVRPRTLAAARLSAAIAMAIAFALATNLPAATFFALVAATHPLLGNVPMVFFGHLFSTVAGVLTVFLALLVVRGAVALTVSTSLASVTAGLLQIASISAVVEALVYVPSLVPFLVRTMIAGGTDAIRIPSIWFTALYSLMVGSSRTAFQSEAQVGLLALAATFVTAVLIYLLPAAWTTRRSLATMSKGHARFASAATRMATHVVARIPAVRATAAFAIASVTRNRRHAFVPLGYLGLGLAIAAISLLAATLRKTVSLEEPRAYLLTLPLVLMFFAVLGLRASFRIPIDLDANWPFRVCGTRVSHAAASARAAMMALAVIPFAAAALLMAMLSGWGADVAAQLAGFDVLTGLLLVEVITFGWHAVPFARAYTPSGEGLKWRGPAMIVPLNLFAFRGADAQIAALQSTRSLLIYVAVIFAAVACVGLASRRSSNRQGLLFDEPMEPGPQTLGLSEAS